MILIAAIDRDRGIGKNNGLLISIPEDMKFFRKMTTGGTVIVGRKTLETFPGGKPLKGRRNIVLTHDPSFHREGAERASGIPEVLEMVSGEDPERVFCIGGAGVYRQLLPYCDRAYITKIDRSFGADAFLPDLDESGEWEIFNDGTRREWNGIGYRFTEYARSTPASAQPTGRET